MALACPTFFLSYPTRLKAITFTFSGEKMKATALSSIVHDRKTLLYLLAIGNTVAFATWQVMLNNFVVERASFGGEEIGILQSLREVPGFLAFTAILVMLIIRQQSFAILSLLLLGLGTAITAFYPTALWLYFSTVVMSVSYTHLTLPTKRIV